MSGNIQLNSRPHKLDGFKSYTVLDEMVIYSTKNEIAFSLNQSAKAVWDLCDGRHTITEICRELGKIFDRSGAELRPDVESTITQLHKLGLVEFK